METLKLSITKFLHFVIIQLAFQLLHICYFTHSFHEILLNCIITICTDRKHSCLGAYIPHVSSVEALGQLADSLTIDFAVLRDVFHMDLDNVNTSLFIRQGNLDLAIQTTGAK